MIAQMIRQTAGFYAPMLDTWQNVARLQSRLVCNQLETASETMQFAADRLRAYATNDDIEGLNRQLEQLTARYGQSFVDRLKETQSMWGEMLIESERQFRQTEMLMPGAHGRRETQQDRKAA